MDIISYTESNPEGTVIEETILYITYGKHH